MYPYVDGLCMASTFSLFVYDYSHLGIGIQHRLGKGISASGQVEKKDQHHIIFLNTAIDGIWPTINTVAAWAGENHAFFSILLLKIDSTFIPH